VNAKTTSDLRSYCAPVVSDERESRTGHVVNCTAQVELHQIYFNIKPESPGDTRLRAPFWPLLSIREVLIRAVSVVVLQCWIFCCGGGGWHVGEVVFHPTDIEHFLLSLNCFDLASFDIGTQHYSLN